MHLVRIFGNEHMEREVCYDYVLVSSREVDVAMELNAQATGTEVG